MKKCLLIASLACLILLSGCVTPAAEFAKLPPGIWRGTLNLENTEVITQDQAGLKKITEAELPFNFEVIYDTEQDFHIELINGSERIRVDDISYGRDKATAKDTVLIKFPVFDTYIRAIYSENVLQGHWFVPYKDDYKVPFVANFGRDHRFESSSDSISIDLNGKWKTMFDAGQESEYPAIANFKQEGTNLTGMHFYLKAS